MHFDAATNAEVPGVTGGTAETREIQRVAGITGITTQAAGLALRKTAEIPMAVGQQQPKERQIFHYN